LCNFLAEVGQPSGSLQLYNLAMPSEADTCRKFVVPKLQAAGWDNDPHSIAEQRYFTKGRILVEVQTEVNTLKRLQTETAAELDVLLPAILDRAFKGEL
jgi:hypothetical protein